MQLFPDVILISQKDHFASLLIAHYPNMLANVYHELDGDLGSPWKQIPEHTCEGVYR